VHGAVARGDPGAARPIHADRMHLVHIGHRAVTLGKVADPVDRRHVAAHGIQALEHDQLRPSGIGRPQQRLQVLDVVVAEDRLLRAGAAHALDHRVVIHRVGQDQAIRQQPGDGGDSGLVGHVARGEDQRRLFGVQIGELTLELDQRMVGAGNIAGAPGAGARAGRGLDHGADHLGVLAHAEIIVGAPDHDVAGALRRVPDRMREPAGDALEIREHPVAALVPQSGDCGGEEPVMIHGTGLRPWRCEDLAACGRFCRADTCGPGGPRP
jgi:hypothetical protein